MDPAPLSDPTRTLERIGSGYRFPLIGAPLTPVVGFLDSSSLWFKASEDAMASGRVEVERVFVGAGCNRIVNNVSWGPSDLVAFGAQTAVAIFCPKVSLSISIFFIVFLLFMNLCLFFWFWDTMIFVAECPDPNNAPGAQSGGELHVLASFV